MVTRYGRARGNVSDVHDAAGVFLYRDSSLAPLLDMRLRILAVLVVLGAIIQFGVSLSRSVELTAQWDRILWLLILCILLPLMTSEWFGAWVLVIYIELLLVFIIVSVTSFMRLLLTVGMRLFGGGGIGFGRTPWFILKRWLRPELVLPAPSLQCKPHLTPGGSGALADPVRIDEEFR